jgi:hypothetical protein
MAYSPTVETESILYTALNSELMTYDMHSDPYIFDLVNSPHKYRNATQKFEEAYFKKDTYCFRELKTLVAKHRTTAAELGASVADWCLQQCLARFHKQVNTIIHNSK